ncbi:mRNA splicing protein [Coemansia sp. RSA 552]|nr:mRNA splicing protein [Coemansia sp. RSA 552]
MSSISEFLPEPKHSAHRTLEPRGAANTKGGDETAAVVSTRRQIPPHGQRKGWVPKTQEDFGDGGAYPEIAMLQYPLGMGRKLERRGNAIAKQVDGEGRVDYSALARQGRREGETVHSQPKDLVPLRQRVDYDESQEAIPERPDAEAVRETTERTRLALVKAMGGGASSHGAKGVVNKEPTYVRYTPNQQGAGFNSGASQRIVRVSDMPVDPMEPPKIRRQKKARRPESPPAPVMHSPPRKVTAEEQREWAIPPSVSNWKNMHGFTVSLDKRLAADGRGLEELSVNDNFARLSEALISAESHARKEIAERANIQQTLARREKEAKEERLRQLAQKAREERAAASTMRPRTGGMESEGIGSEGVGSEGAYEPPPMEVEPPVHRREGGRKAAADFFTTERGRSRSPEDGRRSRDELRRERRKQHERELRLSQMGTEAKAKYLRKAEGRDISEKIALGIAKPSAAGREGLFDSRLFNQASASNAALQSDEAYNLYEGPLFRAGAASSYRPRAAAEEEGRAGEVDRMMGSDRFGGQLQPGLGAKTDGKKPQQPRDGPVEFEKADVFGIDAFADAARQGQGKQA